MYYVEIKRASFHVEDRGDFSCFVILGNAEECLREVYACVTRKPIGDF
jgi:hypothetical protein